jgi:hypothetical protein
MNPPPPSNKVTEILSPIKNLQGLQDIKLQWAPSHCGVVGNVIADFYVKTGVIISQTSVCKMSFNFDKLRIKRNSHADLSRHYATESQHKLWNKIAENRNRIPKRTRSGKLSTNHSQ